MFKVATFIVAAGLAGKVKTELCGRDTFMQWLYFNTAVVAYYSYVNLSSMQIKFLPIKTLTKVQS